MGSRTEVQCLDSSPCQNLVAIDVFALVGGSVGKREVGQVTSDFSVAYQVVFPLSLQ